MGVTLVCSCGKRLKATGAVPGRVGRCPACGGMLRVPEDVETPPVPTASAEPGYDLSAETEARSPAAPSRPGSPTRRRRPRAKAVAMAEDRGLVRTPRSPEVTLSESLLYPLWGINGLALLAMLPPALWLATVTSIGLVPSYVSGQSQVVMLGALTMMAPMSMILMLMIGYVGQFLEKVLIDAAAGEVHHPKLPSWGLMGFLTSNTRLLACLAAGFAVPGFVAIAYWLNCGDLDWADRAILAMILAPGAVYAEVALAAVALFDDLRAANPVTVLSALGRVGGPAFRVGLIAAVPTVLLALAVPLLFVAPGPVAAIGTYLWWVAALYAGMVVARILGRFCRRYDKALGWCPERPTVESLRHLDQRRA